MGQRAEKHLPLLPPDSDAHRPQYSNKGHRCFTLSLESRVITYHQSKLIIADWVGVVNDYRRGRAGTVSHTVSQSMVNLAKGGGGLGGATRLFGLHWETTASQDGQKVRG